MEEIVCCSCGDLCERNVRHKNQCYCPKPGCQRARKAAWKRYNMRTDSEYRFNQRLSSQTWAKAHPGYWSAYRRRHPEKAERNRLLQAIRNRRRRHPLEVDHQRIAKVDALKVNIFEVLIR
jgi:hypothetical protein